MSKRTTILDILKMKKDGEKIAVLTCYDYPTARILDGCGIDVILVGDSAGVVVAGHETTLPVTVEEMIYHTRAVCRAEPKALVVADLPFLSYQTDLRDARPNAGRLVRDGGAEAVKLEGGENVADCIKAIVDMDVPVMAHIGLTPQSIHRMGGFRVQGKSEAAGEKLLVGDEPASVRAFASVLRYTLCEAASRPERQLKVTSAATSVVPVAAG